MVHCSLFIIHYSHLNVMVQELLSFLLADDHFIFRDGLQFMLEKKFPGCTVQQAGNGREMLQAATTADFDIILCDIAMPVMDGIEATRQLVRENPHARVIATTMYSDELNIVKMLHSGARGFVCKYTNAGEMVTAINTVLNGNYYAAGELSTQSFLKFMREHQYLLENTLTQRETEILAMISNGDNSKMIATALALSFKTVENHRSHLLQKTKTHNSAELIKYAVKQNWI